MIATFETAALEALEKVFPQTCEITNLVFAGQVTIALKTNDPHISVPEFGIFISIADWYKPRGARDGKALPVYKLSQAIKIPSGSHGTPDDVDVDEIGNFTIWDGCLYRLCELLAVCLATRHMEDIAAAVAAKEWQNEMDLFYERVVSGGKEETSQEGTAVEASPSAAQGGTSTSDSGSPADKAFRRLGDGI